MDKTYSPLQVREAKEELARRKREEKYRYYTPIGKGEEFIKLLSSGDYIVTLFSAGNGVGKTRLGVNILAHLMFPCGNKWFQQDIFLNWKFPKHIRIISDPTTIHDTIIKEMKDQFPVGRYKTSKKNKTYEAEWITDTGWTVSVMTYDQDVKEFESATVGLVWCDEPPPEPIYKASIARLRKGGFMFITATPLTGSAWMYDEIVANPDAEGQFRTSLGADVEDACKIHGVRGFLDHDQIVKMIAQYDDDDKQARIFGKFQHLTGLVFKKWNKKVHVVEPFFPHPRDYVVIEAIDPHPRNPDAVMWVAVDKFGQKFIVDELYIKASTPELAQRIIEKRQGKRVILQIADPSAFIVDKHTGRSLASDLYEASDGLLNYDRGSKRRQDAIRRTKDALNFVRSGAVIVKPPELYVSELCTRTIWEFGHWQWDDWRGKTAEYKNPKETPMDKDDHMMENIGRILLEEPTFTAYQQAKVSNYSPDVDLDPYARA